MDDRINIYFIIALFIWTSFFPAPIHLKYHLFTNIFLTLIFLTLLARKHFSMFKLNDYPLWLFLIGISINVFFAQQKNVAFKAYLNLAIPMFFIYYLISESFSSEKSFGLLAKTICLSSIAVSLAGILESLFRYNILYEHFIENPYYLRFISGFARPMSFQFNPTPLGGYLLGCLPFNLLLFKKEGSYFKFLGAMGIVLNVVVIILTLSRCAFFGLISMSVFYLLAQKNYRLIFALFIILSVFIYMASYLPYPLSKFGVHWIIGDSGSGMPHSFIKEYPKAGLQDQVVRSGGGILSAYRLTRRNIALSMLKDYPLTGVGLMHFRIRFNEYYPYKHRVPYDIMIADNMYLTILAEAGIFGLIGFLIFVHSLLKRGWFQLTVLNANSQKRWQLLISLMVFVGLLVDMAGYEFFYWPNQYLVFCIVTGCSLRYYETIKKN